MLKIISLNSIVVFVRLLISLGVQRVLAVTLGEAGIAKIGQLRNLMQIIASTSSLGVFNGVVKNVSENREDKLQLQKLFSTTFVFLLIGSLLTSITLFFNASWISVRLFDTLKFIGIIQILAFMPIVIGVNKVFVGIINGLSDYKKYAKIDLISYILSIVLLLIGLYNFSLKGVLLSIIITPIVQIIITLYVFGVRLKEHLNVSKINFKVPYIKELLAFTLMSIVSTVLVNYIELDIRTMITNKISITDAGHWTAMNFISKNYMVFSSSLFTLYVIPKFARINRGKAFKAEVFNIYKTLLPLFGLGMILIYVFRELVIEIIYPNFIGMEPLFKWQLLGDFVRLAALVMSHQFLAKKMLISFIITELISLGLFYFLSKYYVDLYGVQGVVMAHFYRYIIYFVIVAFAIWNYFRIKKT
ncbi:PST family polysaccharide transporter [Ichthyenterobacterium magnum]|uniref:PST family polysaccharide transporter n=1 Tax=Ichthyenterobacterium magnum TaxID=1230530 RepID=A0A420DV13_9FLAO|nr:PST family polysaccharide transporter [Ichthyenterobacterium magnum]